jgi:hemerythrin-like domain-containing protein
MSQEITSKSAIILRKYTPEEIQELLNSESKSSIVERLGLYMEALNKYIKQHNLTYNPSRRRGFSKKHVKKYKETIPVQDFHSDEAEDPVKRFYEMLRRKKEKRALRELKNPYDW